jgi:hypothetical protein
MTLDTEVKKLLMTQYGDAFSTTAPEPVHVVVVDMMQYLKGSLPDKIQTVADLLGYLAGCIKQELARRNGCRVVVACFDTGTVPVKEIVEYGSRREWRCSTCRDSAVLGPCCAGKEPLSYEDGPHLPVNADHRLPVRGGDWMRFASDSRNLRAELYPRLMNYFLTETWLVPAEGQDIFLCGLPCESRLVSCEEAAWRLGYTPTADIQRYLLELWRLDSDLMRPKLEYPGMFEHTYRIYTRGGIVYRHEAPEMRCRILEADNSIFWVARFFPGCNCLFVINDGDAISIGLLRVLEDFNGGHCPVMRVIALPNRVKPRPNQTYHPYTYVDLVRLKTLIDNTPAYLHHGVTNSVATLVFMIILSGTDFFKKPCHGIGYSVLWDTFHEGLPMYRLLIQWNVADMVPDPTAERRIVLDEELFIRFIENCYLKKYKGDDIEVVRARKFKQAEKQVQPRQTMLRWARQVQWNLNYWVNACRNIETDPFKEVEGQPYYGYVKASMSITDNVAPTPEPVDEVYREQKRLKMAPAPGRLRSALDAVRGRY